MEVFLARQPIFNRKLHTVAYELLFRNGQTNSAIFSDAATASAQVLVNAFSEIGLEKITNGKPAFVNIPQEMLAAGGLPISLQNLLVPEVLENVVVDDQVIAIVKNLVEIGYKVALDDFVYSDAWKPLLPIASFIKLDVLDLGIDGVKKQLDVIRSHADVSGKLLAEKVETHEEFETYKDMGFDYFQGYFLCKPDILSSSSVPASQMVILSLLSELAKDDYSIRQVSTIIRQDPRLSYKLLRVVNSASFGLSRTVKTVEDTMVLLGSYELRRWTSMLALSTVDKKPPELVTMAITRAKMCELLATYLNLPNPAYFFTAGLLSMLEALLDRPLAEIASQMPLSAELESALLSGGGEIGGVLTAVLNHESGKFDEIKLRGIDAATMRDLYLQTLSWVDTAQRSMTSK